MKNLANVGVIVVALLVTMVPAYAAPQTAKPPMKQKGSTIASHTKKPPINNIATAPIKHATAKRLIMKRAKRKNNMKAKPPGTPKPIG